jgi:Ca2+-binding EF-hand superfamily protein
MERKYDKIWKSLFSGTRGQTCANENLKKKIKEAAKAKAKEVVKGEKAKKGKFAWVKDWGYGPLAYLIDYLDEALLKDTLKEFHNIYDSMRKLKWADTKEYKDPFNLKKLLSGSSDKKMNAKALKNLKLINKNYNPKIYDISVNTVQIREAMKSWKWTIEFPKSDYARQMVRTYDTIGDGRLNPREILLAAIWNNLSILGTDSCKFCFEDVVKKIDAIFTFIDCNNDGVIKAEDLWNTLPKLKRGSNKFNIFALGNDAGIRTAAVNDFVLLNGESKIGVLNKAEFRKGVLLAMWDRQTSNYKIEDGPVRTLKNLRWKNNDTVDIKAKEYITKKMVKELKKKK